MQLAVGTAGRVEREWGCFNLKNSTMRLIPDSHGLGCPGRVYTCALRNHLCTRCTPVAGNRGATRKSLQGYTVLTCCDCERRFGL
jgi:hypothetical protein